MALGGHKIPGIAFIEVWAGLFSKFRHRPSFNGISSHKDGAVVHKIPKIAIEIGHGGRFMPVIQYAVDFVLVPAELECSQPVTTSTIKPVPKIYRDFIA